MLTTCTSTASLLAVALLASIGSAQAQSIIVPPSNSTTVVNIAAPPGTTGDTSADAAGASASNQTAVGNQNAVSAQAASVSAAQSDAITTNCPPPPPGTQPQPCLSYVNNPDILAASAYAIVPDPTLTNTPADAAAAADAANATLYGGPDNTSMYPSPTSSTPALLTSP